MCFSKKSKKNLQNMLCVVGYENSHKQVKKLAPNQTQTIIDNVRLFQTLTKSNKLIFMSSKWGIETMYPLE